MQCLHVSHSSLLPFALRLIKILQAFILIISTNNCTKIKRKRERGWILKTCALKLKRECLRFATSVACFFETRIMWVWLRIRWLWFFFDSTFPRVQVAEYCPQSCFNLALNQPTTSSCKLFDYFLSSFFTLFFSTTTVSSGFEECIAEEHMRVAYSLVEHASLKWRMSVFFFWKNHFWICVKSPISIRTRSMRT